MDDDDAGGDVDDASMATRLTLGINALDGFSNIIFRHLFPPVRPSPLLLGVPSLSFPVRPAIGSPQSNY